MPCAFRSECLETRERLTTRPKLCLEALLRRRDVFLSVVRFRLFRSGLERKILPSLGRSSLQFQVDTGPLRLFHPIFKQRTRMPFPAACGIRCGETGPLKETLEKRSSSYGYDKRNKVGEWGSYFTKRPEGPAISMS